MEKKDVIFIFLLVSLVLVRMNKEKVDRKQKTEKEMLKWQAV